MNTIGLALCIEPFCVLANDPHPVTPTSSVATLELPSAAAGTGRIPPDSGNVPSRTGDPAQGWFRPPRVQAQNVPEVVLDEPRLDVATGPVRHRIEAYGAAPPAPQAPLYRSSPPDRDERTRAVLPCRARAPRRARSARHGRARSRGRHWPCARATCAVVGKCRPGRARSPRAPRLVGVLRRRYGCVGVVHPHR